MPHTILFLHRGGSQLRGSEDALLTLLDGLDRTEFRPVVVASDPVLREPLDRRGIRAHRLDFPELMVTPGELRLPLRRYGSALRGLSRICAAEGASLLFASGGGPCQLGVPLARKRGIPLVCLFHHPAPRAYLEWWLLRWADTVVFSSEFTRAHTRRRLGRDGEVVYIGIDVERFAPVEVKDPTLRRAHGIERDDVVFGQVGALVPHKGHALLLEAFERVARELPSARLLIVGTGPTVDAVRSLASSRGLSDRVVLTGYVPDTTPYFQHVIDVNVLASSEEGLGLVNIQASACGLPNVATDATGIRETTVHERTGLLFPLGDAGALAGQMLRLGRDAGLRAALGAAGRRLVVERFAQQLYSDRIQDILRDRLAGRPGRAGSGRVAEHPDERASPRTATGRVA